MSQFDSNYAAAVARRMVFGDPAVRAAEAPSIDRAQETDAMSTDANQGQDQATQQVATEIARELHQFASRPEGQQGQQGQTGGAPEGAQAALGGMLGGVLTDAILGKLRGWSVEELELLSAYVAQRVRVRIGEVTGGL